MNPSDRTYLPNTPPKTKEKMKYFSREQKEILVGAGYNKEFITEKEAVAIATEMVDIRTVRDEVLLEFIIISNLLYRGGVPLVSDTLYDFVFLEELKKRIPVLPFLHHG